jgi:aspartokinase-like uncharacterized kinase
MLRVVKVGGSLLDWPPLAQVLPRWLARQSPARQVLVCGGGIWCDALRQAQRQFALPEQAMHWLCIEALTVTARLLTQILKLPPPETDWRRAGAATPSPGACPAVVLDPRSFLYEDEATLPGTVLPHDWTSTSDSFAARLAEVLAADELVLLKSADPPCRDLEELARVGYVDQHLPRALPRGMPLRLVNLRAEAAW